ncbi:MAG: type II toxin-antitoxin system HicB family antitoxin [Sporomusaceae bacterium]|jgi:predicted RNase H-like HicB family nuclease|nr:type II toxin-antitoxin system HicB family antitoxin [Sporomusaceae bacterium]
MAKYVFPVILTPEETGLYAANFPDLASCYTQGSDLADVLDASADVLALTLYNLEENNQPIPQPTPINNLRIVEGQITSLICADTIEYRKFYAHKAVKKTLTIPAWLNTIAEKKEINFSAVLQKALKEELSITE